MHGELMDPTNCGVVPRAITEIFQYFDNTAHTDNEDEEDIENNDNIHDHDEPNPSGQDRENNTSIETAQCQKSVYISVLQIYGETISDMLSDGDSDKLPLRRSMDGNHWFAEGLTEKIVSTPNEVLSLLEKAEKRRFTRATQLNDVSSRSHLIVTVSIVEVSKKGSRKHNQLKTAKLNLVDLAGSERVKDSGATGTALKEAAQINLSLCTLASVVNILSDDKNKQLVPYNESMLTRLLADALGGNCQTTLIATVSPSQSFCRETNRTLTFAHSCKKIQNIVKKNVWVGYVPKGIPFKSLTTTKEGLKQHRLPWDEIKVETVEEMINTKLGKICIERSGNLSDPIVLCSSFADMDHQIPAFLFSGYQFIEVYQPGYGNSPGKTHPSRCEEISTKGGPLDVMKAVISALDIKQGVVVAGYDWGASIALYLAANCPKKVDKVIAFHPSMGDTKEHRALLGRIKSPVLLQWVPADMFHPWKKWKPLISCFKNIKVSETKIHPWNSDCSRHTYEKFSNQVCCPLVEFLTGRDFSRKSVKAFQPKEEKAVSVGGKQVVSRNNVMLADELTEEDTKRVTEEPHLLREAVVDYLKFVGDEKNYGTVVEALINPTHPMRHQVIALLRFTPQLNPLTLATPSMLNDVHFWPTVKGWSNMKNSPRYFPGRRLLVKTHVQPMIGSINYAQYDATVHNRYVTHKATLVDCVGDSFVVRVLGAEQLLHVPVDETLELNQPHVFARNVVGNFLLEDALVFNCKGHAEKAKLLEMIARLRPIIEELDFSSSHEAITAQQLKAIRLVRQSVDFIANNVGGEKIMHKERQTTGSVGKISLRGQGNCHGCSSVIASYLYHLSGVLGLDVKYRSGYSFGGGTVGEVVREDIDRHHTVEVTCRPSMKSFVVDLWFEGVNQDERFICMPVEEFYQHYFYPNGLLVLGMTSLPLSETDLYFHEK